MDGAVRVMDENGKRYDQEDNFEQRLLYQALALIERAGEQQRAAAATLERFAELEQRVNQAIQAASTKAAARIASEARSALDGAFTDSGRHSQPSRAQRYGGGRESTVAVVALPVGILLASLLSAISVTWMTHRIDEAANQVNKQDQRLIDEGR